MPEIAQALLLRRRRPALRKWDIELAFRTAMNVHFILRDILEPT